MPFEIFMMKLFLRFLGTKIHARRFIYLFDLTKY